MPQPVFILALPRSYASLIAAMLGQHPQTYGLPELNLFSINHVLEMWQDGKGTSSLSRFQRHGLLRAVAHIYAGEQTSNAIVMANHWVAARQNRYGYEIFQELIDALSPLMVIDKSPAHVVDPRFLKRLYQAYPEAYFIHLTRHPTTQGEALMKLQDGAYALSVQSIDYLDNEAIIDPQIAWHDINLNIIEFLEQVPASQKLHIRSEDVLSSPLTELSKMCRWLGLRDDVEALEYMLQPELSPFASMGPINALFGNDPNFLREPRFSAHQPSHPKLRAPLAWRPDGACLKPEVQRLAFELGYA